jgi:hypothetical protein
MRKSAIKKLKTILTPRNAASRRAFRKLKKTYRSLPWNAKQDFIKLGQGVFENETKPK